MQKILWFVVVVIIGVFGTLVFANQSAPKSAPSFGASPSPTLALNIPSTSPAQTSPEPSQTAVTGPQGPISSQAAEAAKTPRVTVKTSKGDIGLILYRESAPGTVENFLKKTQSGFYSNLTFHRVEDWVIQGGDPKGNGTGGGQMRTEINDRPFVRGSLGVARGPDINVSNDTQFFITKTDSSHLNQQYTNFGMVTKGLEVVDKITRGDKILSITYDQ